MPKRQVHTTIGGVQYRLTQLGGNTIAELGDQIIEATALTGRGVAAIAAMNRAIRDALVDASFVHVVDEEDPHKAAKWVRMSVVFDDHFAGARAADLGQWTAWATKEAGLPAFLGGLLKGTIPSLLGRLPSVFQEGTPKATAGAAGSPTDSSSPSA